MAESAQHVHEGAPIGCAAEVPVLVRFLHRLGLFGAIALYFFVSFVAARGLLGSWGLPARVLVPALVATALMSVFVVWLAPVLALPEIWYLHVRPERRARRGLCPGCGHPRTAAASTDRCPECGGTPTVPEPWQCTWPTIRTFIAMLVAALVVGVGAGAAWCLADESRFEREASGRVQFERSRAWPADFARLRYEADEGFTSSAFLGSEPIEGWRPRQRR
jgi:hypothetical protein